MSIATPQQPSFTASCHADNKELDCQVLVTPVYKQERAQLRPEKFHVAKSFNIVQCNLDGTLCK